MTLESSSRRGRAPGIVHHFFGCLRQSFVDVPCGEIALLLVTFMLLRASLLAMTRLPAVAFEQPIIVIEMFKSLPGWGWRTLPLLLAVGLIGWRWRRAMMPWSQWEHGQVVRCLVIVATLVLAWPYATYDFNFYCDRWHAVDRTLLVAFFVAACWRPVFVLPFLAVVVPVAAQFSSPLGAISWAAPDQSIHVLTLFAGFYLLTLVRGGRGSNTLLYVACCMVALHYWPSAYTKLRGNWLFVDHIEFLLPNSYANGWLPGLSVQTIAKWTVILAALGPLLKIFTICAECCSLVFLWRRRFAMILLVVWISFHSGIFLVTGICFWQWVAFEACLLLCIWKGQGFRARWFFSFGGFVVAFAIIITSKWWLGPTSLTWFDARATYTYRFYATGESGKTYHLPPRFFAPYQYQFTLGAFRYLSPDPVLQISWGATSKTIADRLFKARSAEDVLAVERELARPNFDPERRDLLVDFLQRFVAGVNAAPARKTKLRMVQAPRLLWTFGEIGAYRLEEPIRRVEVIQVFTFFDGAKFHEIRRRPVLMVDIPTAR